jgi:hypothetical protein
MRQVKVTAGRKLVQRMAVIACVGILGVGAAACGDDTTVTPEAPANTSQQAPAATTPAPAATTPAASATTPGAPATSNPQSGGAGF